MQIRGATPWWTFALAAGFTGIGVFVANQWTSGEHKIDQGSAGPIAEVNRDTDLESERDEEEQLLAKEPDTRTQRELLELELAQLEIVQLERELAQLEKSLESELDPTEVESMILALTPEYSIPLGGSAADVESDMLHVLDKYPNTRGAQLAEAFLSRIKQPKRQQGEL